jgi:hypothetical protein
MPHVVHQDYAHHIDAEPEQVLAPWHLFAAEVTIPEGIPKVWLPAAKVPLLVEQVAKEYMGDPPPVEPKPLPAPYVPEDEPAEERMS